MAWLHTSAASLFGRQCSVYIGVNSMIRVTVLHTLLLTSLSHRMPEQEGSNIANALMAIPNIIMVLLCTGMVAKETQHYVYDGNIDEEYDHHAPTLEEKSVFLRNKA